MMDDSGNQGSNRAPRADIAILVVDDDPWLRASLAATLSRWGYSVGVAADGVEALRCLSLRVYDVIITDLQMPSMDGVTLWRRALVAGHPGTWILMTGALGLALESDIPILRKPFRLPELRSAVELATVGSRTNGMSEVSLDLRCDPGSELACRGPRSASGC